MIPVDVIELPIGQQSCRLCGARRKRTESDDQWVIDIERQWKQHELRMVGRGTADERFQADERPWTRRHVACGPLAWHVVLAITGVELDEPEARAVLQQHGRSLLAGDRQEVTREPWAFLTAREVRELTALAEAAGAQPEPRTDKAGRCGVCGRSRSLSWARFPGLSWSDRSPAPLCSVCAELAPISADADLLKLRALGLLADARPVPSMRAWDYYGLKLAAEILHGPERHIDGAEPWDYRPDALSTVRKAVQEALPEYLLDDGARARGVAAPRARRVGAAAEEARRQAEQRPGGDAEW